MSEQHQSQEEREVIVLTDEDGQESEWFIAHVLTVDEQRYAILLPLVDLDNSDEACIFRIDRDDGEDVLVDVEDEEEFERVVEAFEDFVAELEEANDETH